MPQQPKHSKPLVTGTAVVTHDGETLGTVNDVRGAFFKVDAPHRMDFWLTKGVVSDSNAERVQLIIDNDNVGDFHRDEPAPGEQDDALGLLKEMHDEAKATFLEILSMPITEPRQTLWNQLEPVLKVHEQMEDKYLFGPLADELAAGSELADWEAKHDREVNEVDELIASLDGLNPINPPWTDTLREIHTKLSNHIKEEETDIFPRIRNTWDSDRLAKSRADMVKMMQERVPTHTIA